MELLTPLAAAPAVSVPLLVALLQFKAVIVPAAAPTVLVNVQLEPPMFKAKFAVPAALGVPVMV